MSTGLQTTQNFARPLSCDVSDRDLGMLSSQWGQDFLGQGFFPLSCPTLEAQAHCTAKKKVSIPPAEAPQQQACSDFNYEDFLKREEKLLAKIREFMESPKHNPEKGSIPSERVQNCIKQKHKELYNFVVSTVYANQWHRFIRKHDDIFELIFAKDEGRSLPRIRLRTHQDYEKADQKEEEERKRRECVILNCLKQYLQDNNDDVRVEDFRLEYQRWLTEDQARIKACDDKWRRLDHPPYQEPPPMLPRFRDIIRIVKRHPEDFAYDPNTEDAGQNARIRTAASWKPGEQISSPRSPSKKERPELQVPNSAPARIAAKSISFAVPPEEEICITIPQSGPVTRVRIEPIKEVKPVVSDADPMWQFQERERRLVKEIVDFLDSEEWNPHKGSVPSERVQNCIKAKLPGLYRSVVGAYYSNQWHRFIQSHSGPQGFELFLVQDGKRAVWRIRLEKHTNYKQADEMEKTEREKKEQHQLQSLLKYLDEKGGSCKVDEFIAEYEKQVAKKDELPKRGDFVRFVRRYVEFFDYDSKEFIISCAKAPSPRVDAPDSPLVLVHVSLGGAEPWGYAQLDEAAVFLHRPASRVYFFQRKEWADLHGVGPQPAVRQQTLVAAHRVLYVFGGWLEHSLATYSNRIHALELHPPLVGCREIRGTWKLLQPTGEVPSPRSMHSAVLKDNVMYVLGGQNEHGPVDMDLHAYDLAANAWTRLTVEGDVPTPRYGHTAQLVGDQMYVLGGTDTMDHVYVLDFRSMRWRVLPVGGTDMPPSEEHNVAVLCQSVVHVFNGKQAWALNLKASPLTWRAVAKAQDADTTLLFGAAAHQGTVFTFLAEPHFPPSEPSLTFDRPLTSCSLTDSYGPSYGSMALGDDMDFRRPETAAASFLSPGAHLLH